MTKLSKTTATFVLHLDRCDPSKWTLSEWKLLAAYCKDPNLATAAALSRLGMQLVLDDRLTPTGGTLEQIGWWADGNEDIPLSLDDLDLDAYCFHEVQPIYRGPTQYVVPWLTEDGTEHELLETEAAAQRFLERVNSAAEAPAEHEVEG